MALSLRATWRDKIGSNFKQGDTLFEVGLPDHLRVELSVAERDIQDVKVGQSGKLATEQSS